MDQRYVSFKKLIQSVADFEAISHEEFLEKMKEQ